MPRGQFLALNDRNLMFRMAITLGFNPEEIFYILFNNDESKISLDYLKKSNH